MGSALDRGKGPSGWAPRVPAPPHPEPDVAQAGDSKREIILGARLGRPCRCSRGRCCRCARGPRRGGESQIPALAGSARQDTRAEPGGRTVCSGRGRTPGRGCCVERIRGCGLAVQKELYLEMVMWLSGTPWKCCWGLRNLRSS